MTTENYVYKKEVDWSLLQEGLTLPFDNQVVFGQIMGRFLNRGESKDITLYLNGKSYKAQIRNVNFNPKFKRKKDTPPSSVNLTAFDSRLFPICIIRSLSVRNYWV